MTTTSSLIKEHEYIEQELIELEVIMESEVINYPNLKHVFKKLCVMLDEHEKGEEDFFYKLHIKEYGIPYKKISCEHGVLRKYKKALLKALNSGSEFKMKEALETHGRKLIYDLRGHMGEEDEILYRIPEELGSLKAD